MHRIAGKKEERKRKNDNTYKHVQYAPATPHPNARDSLEASPSKAAVCINFLGIQPTFTQVPPKPHFDPKKRVRKIKTRKK